MLVSRRSDRVHVPVNSNEANKTDGITCWRGALDIELKENQPKNDDDIADIVKFLRNNYLFDACFNKYLSLWTNHHKISIEKFITHDEFLSVLPYLKYVEIYDSNQLRLISKNTEELILSEIGDDDLKYMAELKKLCSFATNFKYITQEGLKEFTENCNQLEKLDATFHEKEKTPNLDCFRNFANLKSLTLRNLSWFDNDLSFIRSLSNLKCLKMKSCVPITERSLEPLANTGIEELILEDSFVTDKGSLAVVGTANYKTLLALKDVKSLKVLHLKNCTSLKSCEIVKLQQDLPMVNIIIDQ